MKNLKFVLLPLLAAGLVVALAAPAEAQRRSPGRVAAARTSAILIGGYWYPRYYYSPRFDYGYPYGPFGVYPPYGYGYYDLRDELTSSVRLQVTPRNAQVFVDGYAAGEVDDFDGIFQRLRVRPGSHEITLYLDGFRTVRQSLYLSPRSDQKIRFDLERLPPGEISELPPRPGSATVDEPAGLPAPRDPYDDGRRRPAPAPERGRESQRFGTLAVRTQPGDAELFIDGERWNSPDGEGRITVQLSEGRHHVEVRKDGFATYVEDVLIRSNNTLTLNVSLLRGDANPR
jgi:hypothetical protein